MLVDTLFGGGRPRGTAIGFDHGRVQRPGWDPIPRSPSDRPIVFRDFWPGFPPDYSTYRQMRWATLIANMAAGRPDDDLGVMTSNLSGCWCFSLLFGAADKTVPRFFDNVVSALGPVAESARAEYEAKAARLAARDIHGIIRDMDLIKPGETPAGWLPDPSRRHQLRYWDGKGWTAHVADDGVPSTDPFTGS